MAMTAAMPITIPSIVKRDRKTFARSAANAICKTSIRIDSSLPSPGQVTLAVSQPNV